MRKILVLILTIFTFTLLSYSCNGGVSVSPPKIWITMDKEFINGNTSEIITLTNNNDFNVNLTWYIDYPDPSLIGANRTAIPDISWIYLEPRWYDMPPGKSARFYIYLNIPENEKNINQSWEAWAVFQLGANGFVNQEYAVRVYIDTPKAVYNTSNQTNIETNDNQIDEMVIISIGVITVFALIVTGIIIKKPR